MHTINGHVDVAVQFNVQNNVGLRVKMLEREIKNQSKERQ